VRYDAPVTDEFKVARRYKLQVRGTDMAGNSNVDDHIIWRLSANLKFQKVEWAAPPQETCDVVGGGGASSGDSGIDGFTLSMAVRHLEPTTQELGYGINRVELVDDFGEEECACTALEALANAREPCPYGGVLNTAGLKTIQRKGGAQCGQDGGSTVSPCETELVIRITNPGVDLDGEKLQVSRPHASPLTVGCAFDLRVLRCRPAYFH
jgi:hypothetical protein